MTRSYQIRGAELPGAAVPSTSEIAITPRRRIQPAGAREAGAGTVTVPGDEVVRVVMENGFVLWTRADDLIRERGLPSQNRDGAAVWAIDPRPRSRAGPAASRGERGLLGLGIKALEFFGVDLKGKAAAALGARLELRLLGGQGPGLYQCSLDDPFQLTPVARNARLPASGKPVLVFLHGTASSTQGSFGKLWEGGPDGAGAAARKALGALYQDRVYALQHRSLTQSPIENALALARQLPDQAELHLVSHSRGGLVGELLCLGQRDPTRDPLAPDWLVTLFQADRTVAEQLGREPLSPEADQERGAAYAADRKRLTQLLEELARKQIKVRRFVRVACPARGTTLASGRLDRWLSVLDYLGGHGVLGDMADFLLAVVKERTDPRTLPGLEAMMPGSALTRLLAHPELVTSADLSVIAGDIEGDSLWSQIKLLASDWFYGAEHDLVVNTGSMFGGIRRAEGGARFLKDQGPRVSHFNYFSNDRSVRWLVAGLTRPDSGDGGFQPIQAARHEAPEWRGAVRRSRAISGPRPLAVVLPGTMGSALRVDDDPVWLKYLALFKGGLGRLGLDADHGEVRPTDLVDQFYGPLLEFLARSHRVEMFPYDWRHSVRDAADRLADQLEVWLPEAERRNQPVHLVAHSMGGLVVRAMIADGGRGTALWRRILKLPNSRFMMLGTPNLGSHEAVRWLIGQNPTQVKLTLLDITRGSDGIVDIVNRFPGLLELLPFDPEGQDFARQDLWRGLKGQLGAGWRPADPAALLKARATWDLLKQAAPDPEHMIYVAGSQPATVMDYRLEDHDALWMTGRKRIEFDATDEGDGTVTWRSGRLQGVSTWYVADTAHDELCAMKRAFPGYLDLLMTGTTARLSATPPARARAGGLPARFALPALPPTDDMPDEAALAGFGFGITRPFEAAAAGQGAPGIQVSLTHGDLAYAKYPVLVGHYAGDSIINAEKALDARLHGALSKRKQLGLYPGPLGSHALFSHPVPGGKPAGALVLGLGQVGELSPGLLAKGVRDVLLDYALGIAQGGQADGVRSAPVTCLLVGSGAGGISPRDAVEAILRGALAANDKLVAAELEDKVVIDRLEFLELFEDVAIAAAEALEAVLRDGELALRANWAGGTLEQGQGRLRRVRWDESPNWWQRLEVIEDRKSETLRFIATTDRARAEETLATGQLRLAEGFIRQASRASGANAEVAKTLFEMLLPNRLKEMAPKQENLVMLVDATSARYPWELLEDRWSQGNRPPAVAAGLLRQFKTPRFRPHPAHAVKASALVVGNPDLGGWDAFCDLPGARQEAQKVANLLNAGHYFAQACIDEPADAVLASLHRRPWRILHLAGHGEHEFEIASGEGGTKAVSGMVIGRHTFLTPGDVEQMRWVPELVFINCCHLGKTQGPTAAEGGFGLLAANLAMQFVEMGVRAVVAAGWAVDDGAAEAFSEGFYTRMLAGEPFGRAVRGAREDIWVRFPDANTWGAYQCYGDPGFRLIGEGCNNSQRPNKVYRAPSELVSDLENHCARSRMRRQDQDDQPELLEALRTEITELLKAVPEAVQADWLGRGDVAAALGFAWGETCAWTEAVDWLEKALAAQVGDCPIRAVEQCASFRIKRAGERLRQLGTRGGSEQERQALEREIQRAIAELGPISQRAPTPERLSLLGGACKRLAWLRQAAAPRRQALLDMAEYFEQAHERDKDASQAARRPPDPYHFNNWVVALALADLTGVKPGAGKRARPRVKTAQERDTLEAHCLQMIQVARERNQAKPNFWDGVAEADTRLALLLAQPELTDQAAAEMAARIAELYREGARRGASPREYDTVREHLDFVQALVDDAGQTALGQALTQLRAAL